LPPQYFFHAAALNKLCLPSAKEALLVALRPLNYNEFLASVNKSCRILDCRDDISDGIIPGAVYVRFGVQFA
jgi:hypothetical protein